MGDIVVIHTSSSEGHDIALCEGSGKDGEDPCCGYPVDGEGLGAGNTPDPVVVRDAIGDRVGPGCERGVRDLALCPVVEFPVNGG